VVSAEAAATERYDQLLAAISERAADIGSRPLASMWPHLGSAYRPGGLFLLGQALQGWDPEVCSARWQAPEAATVEGRQRILTGTRAWHAEAPEPIATVLEVPKRARSTFWLFSHTLVDALVPDPESSWVARYAWGNLYPVGWDKPGDSPWGALREAQDPFVGELLRAHVEMLDPAEVVIICGPRFWHSAAAPAGLDALPAQDGPLIAAGVVDGRAWIVGYHPRYASQGFRVGPYAYADLIASQVRTLRSPTT
jgi:hypothetical protein